MLNPPSIDTPSVLIGIITRNRAHILPKAISSALQQDYPNCRLLVLDDGSTDGTAELQLEYPSVAWRTHTTPLGIIESRNELMREADADFFVSLDDDAWFLSGDEIRLAVARLQACTATAAIAFDILSPERPDHRERAEPQRVSMFIGCGHVLRLAAVRAAGYYAASPGTYGSEEKDLSLRLLDLDFSIELMPGVHVWHDKAWADRDHYPIHRSGVCNELVLTMRRCPLPDLLLVLPLKLVSFVWFWLRRPAFVRAGIAGMVLAVRCIPTTWRTRRPVRRSTFWRASRVGIS